MQQTETIRFVVAIIAGKFRGRADVFVGGESFVYYDRSDRNRRVSPDCYVAFGVDAAAIMQRNGYLIWEAGKPPDLVMEVASDSTAANDLTHKRELYARIGVQEYWRLDASGGDRYGEALVGKRS